MQNKEIDRRQSIRQSLCRLLFVLSGFHEKQLFLLLFLEQSDKMGVRINSFWESVSEEDWG